MKIIGGKHRGRRLLSPKGGARPSSGRLREAIFNILGDRVKSARVWDLFAGSGAMGLEALSRGAASALFIEKLPANVDIIKRNIALCGEEAKVIQGDVMNRLSGEADIIFADPPYGKNYCQKLLQCIADHLALNGILFIEKEIGDGEFCTPLELKAVRRYGGTELLEYVIPGGVQFDVL